MGIEVYNILLRAFVTADVDFDGKVSVEEFDGMIEAAAALPRKFGYKWWSEEKCPDEAARKAVREALFKQIDENHDGGISFDEWLGFALKHYKEASACLPKSLDDEAKDAFVGVCKKSGDAGSAEYRRLYWFHWKCFQAADADRDGMVSGDEFKKMDENGDGSISFDEWLAFSLEHIIAKVAAL